MDADQLYIPEDIELIDNLQCDGIIVPYEQLYNLQAKP